MIFKQNIINVSYPIFLSSPSNTYICDEFFTQQFFIIRVI